MKNSSLSDITSLDILFRGALIIAGIFLLALAVQGYSEALVDNSASKSVSAKEQSQQR
jgi:hypothetical protein